MITEAEFQETSIKIATVLSKRSADLDDVAKARYVYNEAMEDAINFVREMVEHNPQHALSFANLEKEMRHYLPLREIND